jgi:CTD kinase subunit alpha
VLAELFERRSPFSGGHKLDSEQLELIWKLVGTPTAETWPTVDQMPLYRNMAPKKAYPSALRDRFGRYELSGGRHFSLSVLL